MIAPLVSALLRGQIPLIALHCEFLDALLRFGIGAQQHDAACDTRGEAPAKGFQQARDE
jgi:hypothetical protein